MAINYLKKKVFYFTKVIRDNKEINEETDIVFNLEKKIKIEKILRKKKWNVKVLLLTIICLSAFLSVFIPRLLAPFVSISKLLTLSMSIPGLSGLFISMPKLSSL